MHAAGSRRRSCCFSSWQHSKLSKLRSSGKGAPLISARSSSTAESVQLHTELCVFKRAATCLLLCPYTVNGFAIPLPFNCKGCVRTLGITRGLGYPPIFCGMMCAGPGFISDIPIHALLPCPLSFTQHVAQVDAERQIILNNYEDSLVSVILLKGSQPPCPDRWTSKNSSRHDRKLYGMSHTTSPVRGPDKSISCFMTQSLTMNVPPLPVCS